MSTGSRLLPLLFVSFLAPTLAQSSLAQAVNPPKKTEPPPSTTRAESDYALGFKAGLAEHEKLLDETRLELQQVQKEVEKVKTYNDWFLAIYAALSALLVGEGVLSLQKQKKESEHLRKKAGEATKQALKAAADAEALVTSTKGIADQTKKEMEKIFAARKALFSELPIYLEETIQAALNPDTFDLFHKAVVNEVDHLTYLGSTLFRFRAPETDDERKAYCDSLLVTARGHLVQLRPVEALKRIDLFFKLSKDADSIKDPDRSRMYGYRASAYMELLDQLKSDLALKKPESYEKARKYRKEITAALENAKKFNADWAGARFYEAYFYSLFPVAPDITDPAQRRPFFLDGQQQAIKLYRSLIHDYAKLQPNMVGAARMNVCCCLKRLADDSADYKPLFGELVSFPAETQIRANNAHNSASIDQTSEDLWSNLMQEDVFFANALNATYSELDYKAKWIEILNAKADLSPWKERYNHYPNTTMRSWRIRVWEP
jgi:hypothetical protein